MTTTLVVLAHPGQGSFNAAWAQASRRAAAKLGHHVLTSDLYAQDFDPVERAAHFESDEQVFDVLKAQDNAAQTGSFSADVTAEIEKVRQADTLIFHFPIWWFSPPAMLKGWCDRVLAHGALHTVDTRFDKGLCTDKQVLFCATTGASAAECAPDGKEGDVRMLLWPLAYTMRYLGMTVLQPDIIHGVHGYFEGKEETALQTRLAAHLQNHHNTIAGLATRPRIPFHADDDFDENGTLKPGVASHSPFIQHRP